MVPLATRTYYERQTAIADQAIRAAGRWWRQFDPLDMASWDAVGQRLFVVTAAAQLASAMAADPYLDAVLAETRQPAGAVGKVQARSLAGIASDGWPLESLVAVPALLVRRAVAGGAPVAEAMAGGLASLTRIVDTQVADAGRISVGVGIAARPDVGGYVRMVSPGACSRCVVLAGKFYRWNEGFERHPSCQCVHIPARENIAGNYLTDPDEYFRHLSPAEQDRIFTKAGAQAIRDGADIGQVVNARRGMETAATPSGRKVMVPRNIFGRDVYVTTEGMTRYGLAGQRLGTSSKGVRLMPESIYREAKDRDDAIRLLKRFGFIL